MFHTVLLARSFLTALNFLLGLCYLIHHTTIALRKLNQGKFLLLEVHAIMMVFT